jgi:hypothetical protein
MSEVTVISIGTRSEPLPDGGQAAVIEIAGLAELRDAAAGAATPLVWLLDASATPSSATLPPLLEHADAPAASLPVDADGAPIETALGKIDDDDVEALLARILERRVPLRHTAVTSLLLGRELAAGVAPPDPDRFGRYAGTEWTARVFVRRAGMLVPGSRIQLDAPRAGSPLAAMRMTRSGTWRRGEALRELHRATLGRARQG